MTNDVLFFIVVHGGDKGCWERDSCISAAILLRFFIAFTWSYKVIHYLSCLARKEGYDHSYY